MISNSNIGLGAALEDAATFLRIQKINFFWSHYLLENIWTGRILSGTREPLAQEWLYSFFGSELSVSEV